MSDQIQIVHADDVPSAVTAILVELRSIRGEIASVKTDVAGAKEERKDLKEEIAKINRVITLGKGGWLALTGMSGVILYVVGAFDKLKTVFGFKIGG